MAKTVPKQKLSLKQEAFALFYATSGNAYQSAIKAGYSETTALAKSAQWLEKVGIKQAIEAHKVPKLSSAEQLKVTPEWITSRLAQEALGTSADTTQSARVAALRSLADIHGMMSGSQQGLPDGLLKLLDWRARELAERAQPVQVEARMLGNGERDGETGEGGGTS